MKTTDLNPDFHMFGNKGTVWNNSAHIAKNNSALTLCNTPMLSTNWAKIEKLGIIGCQECVQIYHLLGLHNK